MLRATRCAFKSVAVRQTQSRQGLVSARAFSSAAAATARSSMGRARPPPVKNEPFLHYAPGSPERAALKEACKKLRSEVVEIPCVVGGEAIYTGKVREQVMPTDHGHVLCKFHEADEKTAQKAIDAAMGAKREWEELPFDDRAAIFLKASDLLSTTWRARVCAATMLGQGKNVWQAEIDAAVETIDFWRFGPTYAQQIMDIQPPEHAFGNWNRMEYRPLEGFVYAITPFNFTAIGANLPGTPALVGNTALWKPSGTAMLSNWMCFEILREAGLPPGVINFLPGRDASNVIFDNKNFGGLHFTGSTATFNGIWRQIAQNLEKYRSYPRIVGETGGKNFHFVHSSAADQIDSIVNHTIRSAFEYQGQKCSACSRAYIPKSMYAEWESKTLKQMATIKQGDVDDFSVFMTAVIDAKAFERVTKYIDAAKKSSVCTILTGGGYDKSKGFFIEPTIILTTDPHYETMEEELFGPVLTVYVYDDADYEKTLKLCDETSPYALTGALFASDRYALDKGSHALRHSAGNFYINDKCTGSIVAQQPFGGARGSGTNDKSGSALNYLRWMSARSIKENFLPQPTLHYPHQEAEEAL